MFQMPDTTDEGQTTTTIGAKRSDGVSRSRHDDALVQLAVSLIDVESLSGHEQPMSTFLEHWLGERGWKVKLQPVAPQKWTLGGQIRHNVYAHRVGPAERTGGPRVLFNSHIDTVPPFFGAEVCEEGGETVIKGRGACDTKGILAAQLTALQQLVDEGCVDVGLLYVVSEETDHSGMIAANALGLDPEFMVVGEPTGSKMMRLQKGMLKVKLSCTGVACHSGYPHLGESALDPMIETLHALKHTTWPANQELGETTMNIGLVKGGQAANALAEASEAVVMFRLIEAPEPILEAVEAIAKEHGVTVEVISKNSPVSLETLPGFETDVAAYNTDVAINLWPPRHKAAYSSSHPSGAKTQASKDGAAGTAVVQIRYLKLNRGKALLYGPGSIHHAHSRTEKIGVAEIRDAVDAYKTIAKACLARSSSKCAAIGSPKFQPGTRDSASH